MDLGCKQLISLPAETINARFGLPDKGHGLAVTVMGDVSMGLTGLGFIYTGEDCVSVGLGINLDQLEKHHLKPYEVLQRYLNHPFIAPLIAGGKLMEYGAHLIPEGGWREMPRLYTDGVMVAGDAATMVNALHWEGTNMAILAGKAAAETALEAHIQIVSPQVCARCESKVCLSICPVGAYREPAPGQIQIANQSCIECGSCRVVCPHANIRWKYPRGGFGIAYKFG